MIFLGGKGGGSGGGWMEHRLTNRNEGNEGPNRRTANRIRRRMLGSDLRIRAISTPTDGCGWRINSAITAAIDPLQSAQRVRVIFVLDSRISADYVSPPSIGIDVIDVVDVVLCGFSPDAPRWRPTAAAYSTSKRQMMI